MRGIGLRSAFFADDDFPFVTHSDFSEETYEIIEAIEENDKETLKEELGDLTLHILFQAELANQKGKFNIYDCINNINKKLINRHPHIFSHKKDR